MTVIPPTVRVKPSALENGYTTKNRELKTTRVSFNADSDYVAVIKWQVLRQDHLCTKIEGRSEHIQPQGVGVPQRRFRISSLIEIDRTTRLFN